MFKTLGACQKYIRENQIEVIDFKMVDIDGRWRHVAIPAERLTENTMKHGIGFDGSNYGFAPVENSDMVYIPDLSTAFVDPYARVKTLVICGDAKLIGQKENRDFDQYPRNVLRRATEYLKETGIADEMLIGPEFEFYVFDNCEVNISPNEIRYGFTSNESQLERYPFNEKSNYHIENKAGYHVDLPADSCNDLRSAMALQIQKQDIRVKYHHHEVGGCGQQEIEVELCEVNRMADNTMAIKYIVKNEAIKDGKIATFLPKPVYGEAGNGMHVHMLLRKDGQPVFYDENGYGSLSKEALWFIGGLLKHARSLCAITNPTTNSYRRLVPGFEAPVTIGYAMANRSAVVRIPAYVKDPNEKRFELRNPDATCNPYYCYAAILMAGLDGIENRIDPQAHGWGPFDFNLYNLSDEEKSRIESLPASLNEAIDALKKDHDYLLKGGVFTERLLEIWIDRKLRQLSEIEKIPHPAEIAKYLDL
ncbi:MAG: type I glutamate--ammonia ligase [Erysipelotrichaceae bacterium]|nr:type I glutamate--ammonia ligase [Erysipelotrichaceae bacterium]